ncbi:hypothetical protein [uncultured Phenylobacterium sp.]|uniref:hypothetical protein n=1 Tax=uncultured Phenylobacterium sp. TaxID=349273 RepID=UPI0025F497F5|nr:hypothetical protein [uncultured Phenylobacterium sp.]
MKIGNGAALAAALMLAAGPAWADVKVPEGTEFRIRLEDSLSSKTAQVGDRFTVSLDDDVRLSDGTILRAGYRGVGEVVDARKNGMLGKTGKLNISLSYIKIGDERVRLRANRATQGEHNTGAQVATGLILFPIWPVAALIKGKSTTIPKGTMLTAYSDSDIVLRTPLPPPPPEV